MKLLPPCSYQGGKQRLSEQIVDIIFEQNEINEDTKFYDLCCGSGAITLELVNRGIHPSNITMVDSGCFGKFWNTIANDEFEMSVLTSEVDKLPSIENIQSYLQELSNSPVDENMLEYHYLLLQSGSFGSKQIWTQDRKWKNNSFRNYWKPTETSNRKSPVNPMMPMPKTIVERVDKICDYLSGNVIAIHANIDDIDFKFDNNSIIYIDPPYTDTTKYGGTFDYSRFIKAKCYNVPTYVSEGYKFKDADFSVMLSYGRKKGSINGVINKKPTEEWLNVYNNRIILENA